jgi:hypothetical protein
MRQRGTIHQQGFDVFAAAHLKRGLFCQDWSAGVNHIAGTAGTSVLCKVVPGSSRFESVFGTGWLAFRSRCAVELATKAINRANGPCLE